MSHFAKVQNGVVIDVIVAEQDFINTLPSESGVSWVQTSYNTRGGKHYDPVTGLEDDIAPLRANYASIGGVYDSGNDVFYRAQPYASWTLDSGYIWQPPIAYPDDGNGPYDWDEDAYQADNTAGWVVVT